ncbi:hypothetical protein N7465_011707 [Penicillium sp. CMV-2018d]|nr:hypothetical protein N7465_011707 [Penicillium sp. CMV-2018d]
MSSKSSKLAKSRREQGEKRREDEAAESRRREEERRDEFADFLARGFKRAFDLDRHRSASPRERQAPPPCGQEFRGRPSRHDSRAADLGRQGLPANTPSGPSRRGLDTSRWNPHRQAPPQEEASREARSGNKPSTTGKAPASESFHPDDDTDMPSLPPTPPYLPKGTIAALVASGAAAIVLTLIVLI